MLKSSKNIHNTSLQEIWLCNQSHPPRNFWPFGEAAHLQKHPQSAAVFMSQLGWAVIVQTIHHMVDVIHPSFFLKKNYQNLAKKWNLQFKMSKMKWFFGNCKCQIFILKKKKKSCHLVQVGSQNIQKDVYIFMFSYIWFIAKFG